MSKTFKEVCADCDKDIQDVTMLHSELLKNGISQLGDLILYNFFYRSLIKEGLIKSFLLRINDESAGFITFTEYSSKFMRRAFIKYGIYLVSLMFRTLFQNPKQIRGFINSLRLVAARRPVSSTAAEIESEVLALGVLPEFRKKSIREKYGTTISEDLIKHVAKYLRQRGVNKVRMYAEKDNLPLLFLYSSLGAEIDKNNSDQIWYLFWFDLDTKLL